MAAYLRRRAISTIPVILGVSFLVFMMLHLLPGDPATIMLTEYRGGSAPAGAVTEERYEEMRRQLKLDQPLYVQFGAFLWGVARGDLGESFRNREPVRDVILRNLPHTIRLAVASLSVALVIGLVLGAVSASHRGSWIDGITMNFAVLGVSMPNFWLGIMLILVFSLHLGLIPAIGAGGTGIILPAFALGTSAAGIMARLVRSSLIEVLNQDYIRTARAKGLSERRVLIRHAMRNALIPVVTVAGIQFGNLLGGTVIIETVFARPGIGHVVVTAIIARDFPVVQGVVLIASLTYVLSNLCIDLIYAWIDPRISF